MALSIEEIMRRSGIAETAGNFDQAIEDGYQERILQDNRRFLPGKISSNREEDQKILAELDAKVESRKKAKSSKNKPSDELIERIRKDEASPLDVERGTFSFYEEQLQGSTIRNIGPGLNLEDKLTSNLFKKHGLNIEEVIENRGVGNIEGANEKLENVFRERVSLAQSDAIKYVGGKQNWNHLNSEQQDALTNMSYNLGIKKLSSFKKTKALLDQLFALKSGKEGFSEDAEGVIIDAIGDEMRDSRWFNQVKGRGARVVAQFTKGSGKASSEWDKLIHENV